MQMANKVEIFNRALGLVGADRIIGSEDTTANAQICRDMYPIALHCCLEEAHWTFATTKHTLSMSLDDLFLIPNKTITIISVSSRPDRFDEVYWERVGGYIYCGKADVLYVSVVSEVGEDMFSPSFASAVAYRLASDIAPTLTSSASTSVNLFNQWTAQSSRASTLDGMQGKRQVTKSNTLIEARYRGKYNA